MRSHASEGPKRVPPASLPTALTPGEPHTSPAPTPNSAIMIKSLLLALVALCAVSAVASSTR